MVSCPSINLNEMKKNKQEGHPGSTVITDLVSGEKTTVGKVFQKFTKALSDVGLIYKEARLVPKSRHKDIG